MCGFAGFIADLNAEEGNSILAKMNSMLVHRGPDAQSSHYQELKDNKALGLAHCLLHIMGKENEGIQPFKVDGGVLVFNGAIYNFKELRSDYEKKGFNFKTGTDTEVLAYGLREEGVGFLPKTRGMFAFAFWDEAKQKLLLGRDPLGVKPLYYSLSSEGLYFGSEYKAFLPYLKNVEINKEAVNDYLRLRYTPGDSTLVSGIKKIDPGCVLEIDGNNLKSEKQFYFNLNGKVEKENLFEVIREAIQRRAVADVEVAALLSGGIDSSVACDFLGQKVPGLKTYTLKISEADLDESSEAKRIAAKLDVENISIPSQKVGIQELRSLAYHLDDPYGDPIILALDKIFKNIKGKQKVVVTGEGADEIFSGYVHHRAMGLLDKIPRFLFMIGLMFVRFIPMPVIRFLLPYSGKTSKADLEEAIQRLKEFDFNNYEHSVHRVFHLFSDEHLVSPEKINFKVAIPNQKGIDALRIWDFRNWLTCSQLFKLDKISMASSIEAREPFVDQDLVQQSLSIPGLQHVSFKTDKPVFRKAMLGKSRVGDDIIDSRKTSFFQPFNKKSMGELPEQLKHVLNQKKDFLSQFIKEETLDKIIKDEDTGLLTQKRIFALAMFAFWHDEVWSLRNKGVQVA